MAEPHRRAGRHGIELTTCVLIVLSLNLACVRSEPLQASAPASDKQSLPFHSKLPGDDGASSGTASSTSQVPFHSVPSDRVLPAGTLLTVRLEKSFSAGRVRAGDLFDASIMAPVPQEGKALLDRGTAVTGRVESIRSLEDHTKGAAGTGYFKLTLNSINMGGKPLAVQTSSLFARETLGPTKGLGVQKGHYLTFRLIAPVNLDREDSPDTIQSGSQTTQ